MERNKRSWKDQKIYLCAMIKQISDHYGGDEIEWLRDYAKLIIDHNKNDFLEAIECFEDLVNQTKYTRKIVPYET